MNEKIAVEVERAGVENELLRDQARLTGNVVRKHAGEADRLERRVEEVQDMLNGARRQVDDIGARNRNLQDELDDVKTEARRVIALERELEQARVRIFELEQRPAFAAYLEDVAKQATQGKALEVAYRCLWFTEPHTRCKATFNSTEVRHTSCLRLKLN